MIKTKIIYPKRWDGQVLAEPKESTQGINYKFDWEKMKDYPKEAIEYFKQIESQGYVSYTNSYHEGLDSQINKFCEQNKIKKKNLIDIKYSVGVYADDTTDSALLIWEGKN